MLPRGGRGSLCIFICCSGAVLLLLQAVLHHTANQVALQLPGCDALGTVTAVPGERLHELHQLEASQQILEGQVSRQVLQPPVQAAAHAAAAGHMPWGDAPKEQATAITQPLFLFIGVLTTAGQAHLRNSIRQTWGRQLLTLWDRVALRCSLCIAA